jgi:hypothetical protein
MARALTARQQRFGELLAAGDYTQTQIYRMVYPAKGQRHPQTVRTGAYRLAKNPRVRALMETLRSQAPERRRANAMADLDRIRRGELDPAHALAVRAQLREAQRAERHQKEAATWSKGKAWREFRKMQLEIARRTRVALSPEERTRLIFERLAPPFVERPIVSVVAQIQERLGDLARLEAPVKTPLAEELQALAPAARAHPAAGGAVAQPRREPEPVPEGPLASVLVLRGESPRSADVPRYRRELYVIPGHHPPRWKSRLVLDDSQEEEVR